MSTVYRTDRAGERHHRRAAMENQKHHTAANGLPANWSVTDIEKALERMIRDRTGGRVRGLRVQIWGERFVLCGWTGSHHVVQLAIAGLFEGLLALSLDRPEHVELDIDVASR